MTVQALAASIVDTMTRRRPRVSARKPQICDENRIPGIHTHNETFKRQFRHTHTHSIHIPINVTELIIPFRVAVSCMSHWAAVMIRPMPIVSVSTLMMMIPQTSSTITCIRPKPARVFCVCHA